MGEQYHLTFRDNEINVRSFAIECVTAIATNHLDLSYRFFGAKISTELGNGQNSFDRSKMVAVLIFKNDIFVLNSMLFWKPIIPNKG